MASVDGVDIDKIAFLSKYPIDKIVGYEEGSFNVAAAGTDPGPPPFDIEAEATETITHNLGYAPLTDLIWSIDNTNFRPSGTELITDFGNASLDDTYDSLLVIEKANTTTVSILAASLDQTARTIYYKLWLIYPD